MDQTESYPICPKYNRLASLVPDDIAIPSTRDTSSNPKSGLDCSIQGHRNQKGVENDIVRGKCLHIVEGRVAVLQTYFGELGMIYIGREAHCRLGSVGSGKEPQQG